MGQCLSANKRSAVRTHSQSVEEDSYTAQALAALSTAFPDAIAELILNLSTGYVSIHSEEVYSAEKVHRCSFADIIEPTPTPHSIPRMMLKMKMQEQLGGAEMTLSFRFKATRACHCEEDLTRALNEDSNGWLFAIKFLLASDIAYGRLFHTVERDIRLRYGSMLQKQEVIDGEWHVVVLRIISDRGVFQIMIDDARTAEQLRYEDFMDCTFPDYMDTRDSTLEKLALRFGGNICKMSAEARLGMDGEIADIRVYDWVLDQMQCQMLMDNYTTPYRKRKDADGNAN